ncbi:Hypothetical predicted protein [Pelobates cultripes]|uniref:Myb/SANT-like DNA-binding domain-containing protein n=1 Tax=Pelobates cultripes TaxID=61616 RepID=A0AAD1R913_PELCU|nr:Hypothetical predicted protein [Pelobates cultripes]
MLIPFSYRIWSLCSQEELRTMAENFLLLDSMGNYSAVPDGMAKQESVREPGTCGAKMKQEGSETRNSGYELFRSGRSSSSPDIIVKIEPDEEPCMWKQKQNGDREMGHNTGTIIQHQIEGDDLQLEESSQSQQQAERERQRNVRFSEEENDVLINSIMPHYDRLFGKFAARNSTAVKNALWREIVSSVNAISAYPRSVQNCKKRYADIKRKVKDKLSKIAKHRRATGGGAPLNISFWPYERVMEKMISADIVSGVPGATDSGRMLDQYFAGGPSDHYMVDLHDSQEVDDDEVAEGDEFQTVTHDDTNDQDYTDDNPDIEDERSVYQEDMTRENRPEPSMLRSTQDQISNVRKQTIRDHTTLIYAEQSHFRRTMAKKLDILNNNVKILNRNVKTFQKSFSQSIGTISETMKQQNLIFEKLSSNLLLMAEQQQQHNQQCMTGLHQVLQSSRECPSSPSESLSETSSIVTTECVVPLEIQARRGTRRHWRRGQRGHKPAGSAEQMSKKSRH